jgi:acetylornithine deacetylase/succinyl-diaminopimelate desuccinylase-like protein
MPVSKVILHAQAHLPDTLRTLSDLVRIPSVSAPGFDARNVTASAHAVAEACRAAGLEHAEVVGLPGRDDVHPAVLADWLHAPGAPTLLLYAHHDVQPPGREALWTSRPFEPTERGGRLYGRGVVDDKAGLMVHLGAISAWLRDHGSLPVNLRLLVEGEEETGSTHLQDFLRAYLPRLQCDAMVLTDTANLDAGIPSITTALRGLVTVNVAVKAAQAPLHSGMWGGPVPDAAQALTHVLGRLILEDGSVNVPGLDALCPPTPSSEKERLRKLPFREPAFRAQAGLLAGVSLAGEQRRGVYEKIWWRPALAINALEASSMAGASNQLVDVARARLGLRIPAGVDPLEARRLLMAQLKRLCPPTVQMTTDSDQASPGWRVNPEGPAFEAAARALEQGYGKPAAFIGCGATIPFVQPLSDILGGVPALLLGLEDPLCLAHSENESLLLSDFSRALFSACHLYQELRTLPVRTTQGPPA